MFVLFCRGMLHLAPDTRRDEIHCPRTRTPESASPPAPEMSTGRLPGRIKEQIWLFAIGGTRRRMSDITMW